MKNHRARRTSGYEEGGIQYVDKVFTFCGLRLDVSAFDEADGKCKLCERAFKTYQKRSQAEHFAARSEMNYDH